MTSIDTSKRRCGVGRADDEGQSLRDRKSTRLNSSHLGISYAVFCLKKKKKKKHNKPVLDHRKHVDRDVELIDHYHYVAHRIVRVVVYQDEIKGSIDAASDGSHHDRHHT